MIDLHTHTSYSDGTDSVKELLSKANELDLEVLSITDHDICSSYLELENIELKKLYKGEIIIGCEFTCSFDNRIIEILGYGFDYKKVSKFLNNFYNDKFKRESKLILRQRLIDKIKQIGLKCNIEKIEILKEKSISFVLDVYKELITHSENKQLLNENVLRSYSDFCRRGIYNPESKLFLNYAEFKPSLKQIIDLVHNSGGIVFLAHPYQYQIENIEQVLNEIYDSNKLDGIECFYTTFTEEQTKYLIEFAQKRNLLISGGSDYHGTNKKEHKLGIGSGNLNIKKSILTNWNINYYKKEPQNV